MDYLNYKDDPRVVLCHFNKNHDPKTGQFTSGSGGTPRATRYYDLPRYGEKKIRTGRSKYVRDDGLLTLKGKARFEREKRANAQKKKENRVSDENQLRDPDRWVKEDIANLKKAADEGKAGLRAISEVEKTTRKKQSFDLSSVTDAELRDKVNRMNLEDSYARLISNRTETISKGRKFINSVVDIGVPVLTVGSTALSVALAIKELRS